MKGVKMGKGYAYSLLLLVVTALFFAANLFWGAVDIPYGAVIDILSGRETDHQSWAYIIWESRLPQCVTALLCGAALSVSGLMLQTVFYNPLADSSILGISSGSSLGVAIVMLIGGGSFVFRRFCFVGLLGTCCFRLLRSRCSDSYSAFSFGIDKEQRYAAHCRHYDRLRSIFRHIIDELFLYRRRRTLFRYVGIRKFQRSIIVAVALVLRLNLRRITLVIIACKTT